MSLSTAEVVLVQTLNESHALLQAVLGSTLTVPHIQV